MKPKVSIIIPTYNRAHYLKKAIESAIKQTYENLEIIIADNCSNDNTPDIVNQFANDTRVKYFKNESNLGMVGNWSVSLYKYISGEWGIILSDDDYFIDNDYLKNAMKLLSSDKSLVLIHANQIVYHEELNKMIYTYREFPQVMDGKDVFMKFNKDGLTFHFATTLFKVDELKRLHAFEEADIMSIDWLEFLKLCLYGNVGFIKSYVAVYRKHKGAITNTAELKMLLKNTDYILIPYMHALKYQVFTINEINMWKDRMLKEYFYNIYNNVILSRDNNKMQYFIDYLDDNFKEYKNNILYNPVNLLKRISIKIPILFNLLKLIKNRFNGIK